MRNQVQQEKFKKIREQIPLGFLPSEDQLFIEEKFYNFRLTHQETRKLVVMGLDFKMWNEGSLKKSWDHSESKFTDKKRILSAIEKNWEDLKAKASDYSEARKFKDDHKFDKLSFEAIDKPIDNKIFGKCPVASPKTLCCNLQTLDAVDNCSFDCTYCSIQSFFPEKKIYYTANLQEKLSKINLDPDRTFHIGTGQSSDSLLVGNRGGVLDALFEFAMRHPNLILELKTKSKNINYLLENVIPKNVICTWSLNTQTVIDAEEHGTSNLDDRISSARAIADKGNLVGFHFHPMIYYDNHLEDYAAIAHRIQKEFSIEEVALVSIGTLTFAKPVISTIRKRPIFSKVLQIPLVDNAGKLTYPIETKLEMFSNLYKSLKAWHKDVFFYFCMENRQCWSEVFKYEYKTNDDLEIAMHKAYFSKAIAKGHDFNMPTFSEPEFL